MESCPIHAGEQVTPSEPLLARTNNKEIGRPC